MQFLFRYAPTTPQTDTHTLTLVWVPIASNSMSVVYERREAPLENTPVLELSVSVKLQTGDTQRTQAQYRRLWHTHARLTTRHYPTQKESRSQNRTDP